MKTKISLIIFIFLGIIIFQIFHSRDKQQEVVKPTVTIQNKTFTVEVADSVEERIKGLSGRKTLPVDGGMLFIFEQPGLYAFWMKNTLLPLDMLFIQNGRIVTIHHNVQPQLDSPYRQLKQYQPKEPAMYVLEINGGLSQKFGFQEGDTVEVEGL